MKEILEKLDKLIVKTRSDYYASLQPPISATEIEELEKKYATSLPADLKTFYQWKNGQAEEESEAFVTNSMFLPLDRVLETQAEMNAMIGAEFTIENWWNEGWLPLFDNGDGCYICYDLNGTFTGKPGQILEFWKNDNDRPVISPDLGFFLQKLVDYYNEVDPSGFDEFFDISDSMESHKQVFLVGTSEKQEKKAWWKFGKK